MDIGQKIKIVRKQAKLTQKELAEKIGTTNVALAQWERGLRNPKLGALQKIAAVCNCDLSFFASDGQVPEEFVHEKQKTFEEEMKRQEERRKHIDDLCLQSLEAMSVGMEMIEKVLVENDTTIEQLGELTGKMAALGSSMAQLRMYMGFGWSGMGFGCTA